MQGDLFDKPPVAGLRTIADLIDPGEEAALIAAIDATTLAPFRFQGWTGKRLTASFGWSYDFDTGGFGAAAPIPDFLLPLRARVGAWAGIAPDAFEQVLLIRYDPGATIGWHRDRPLFEHVVGVSLGAPADLRLRRRRPGGFDRATVPLTPRAAYLLSGEVRHEWEHSIAALPETRWSITFRTLSDRGRSRARP
jgi:alkylated DNA repair dioxygenase AlkB